MLSSSSRFKSRRRFGKGRRREQQKAKAEREGKGGRDRILTPRSVVRSVSSGGSPILAGFAGGRSCSLRASLVSRRISGTEFMPVLHNHGGLQRWKFCWTVGF